ncbi:MAG: branched-chain amino acid transaminase [bacterium]|nr:branched-chain amino acid transaminase [bacterium]
MALEKTEKIWMDGKFIPWDDAKIHCCSHVVHYGTAVFEGMRVYKTPKGSAAFRLDAHVDRLFNSAKIYRMEIPYTRQQITDAIMETVRANKLEECYVRPVVYRGYGELGVNPFPNPVNVFVAAWPWGAYLGKDALEGGVDVCVSSWTRIAPNTLPALAKSGANYMNSQLIKMEALQNGYVEGIALDASGYVSEGSGENVFVVRRGRLMTPPLGASVLPGITRDCVIILAEELGIEVVQQLIPREALYIAEEVFLTGSAAEITPIRSVDKITVGEGRRGPITKRMQERFFGVLNGELEDTHEWLTYL